LKINIKKNSKRNKFFADFARYCARFFGHPLAFVFSCSFIILWLVAGPVFSYSDTWQLVVNTTTTVITFLMVFLIQNTQNRDGEAIQIKLDELIRAHKGGHNALLDLEELTEEQLHEIKEKYEKLTRTSRQRLPKGKRDTETTEV
jgi:low affinity Fe/Cu permease